MERLEKNGLSVLGEQTVFVFRTSVATQVDADELTPKLNRIQSISKWNFDLEDCDNILRVESESEVMETVVKLLNDNGFMCEELPD